MFRRQRRQVSTPNITAEYGRRTRQVGAQAFTREGCSRLTHPGSNAKRRQASQHPQCPDCCARHARRHEDGGEGQKEDPKLDGEELPVGHCRPSRGCCSISIARGGSRMPEESRRVPHKMGTSVPRPGHSQHFVRGTQVTTRPHSTLATPWGTVSQPIGIPPWGIWFGRWKTSEHAKASGP
jgi:hypothetical protein